MSFPPATPTDPTESRSPGDGRYPPRPGFAEGGSGSRRGRSEPASVPTRAPILRWLVAAAFAAGPSAAQAPLPVDVLEVRPTRIAERLSTTGTIRASEEIDVVTEIPGRVEEIAFREGQPVAEDTVLLRLDDAERQAELDRIRHRLELAVLREERLERLAADGVISSQELDVAVSERAALEAERRLAEARLEKTVIRAPFSGVLGLRDVSPGAWIEAGDRITTLQDLDPARLDFTVPERHLGTLGLGRVVAFRVQGLEREFTARIVAIEPRVDPQSRSVLVRAECRNPGGGDRSGAGGRLLPGAFAEVELDVAVREAALTVPARAVITALEGTIVYVERDGRLESRPIETGIRSATEVEVTSGLEAGERVAVSAIGRLRNGLEIEPRVVDSGSSGAGIRSPGAPASAGSDP